MPEYIVTSPQGKKYRVTAPEGATKEEIDAFVQKQFEGDKMRSSYEKRGLSTKKEGTVLDRAMANQAASAMPIPTVSQNPTTGMSDASLAVAGYGKAGADLAQGAAQLVGLQSGEDVRDTQQRDAALLNTTPGAVGNFAGNVAATAPAFMAPGAATVKGAAVAGGVVGALEPTSQDNVLFGKTVNALTGAGLSAGITAVGNLVKGGVDKKEASLKAQRLLDQDKTDLIKDAQKVGLVVPPGESNPTLKNKLLQGGVSGNDQTNKLASIKNQEAVNRLVKEDLGVNTAIPMDREEIYAIRNKAGQAFDKLRNVGTLFITDEYQRDVAKLAATSRQIAKDYPGLADKQVMKLALDMRKKPGETIDSASAVELMKQLKFEGNANKYNRAGDPQLTALGRAQLQAAEAMENLFDKNLYSNPDLLRQFREDRVLYAKTVTAEKALRANGDFSARVFAQEAKKGKPLSGNMKLVGEFAETYPKANQPVTFAEPGVSVVDMGMSGIGSIAAGNPGPFAWLAARPFTRNKILSPGYQAKNTIPSYQTGFGLDMLRGAAGQGGQTTLKSLLLPNVLDKINAPESD